MRQTQYFRWHRYDTNNVKYITQYPIGEHPEPISELNYTDWKRGTGKHSPEVYVKVAEGIRKACRGVAKTDSTKQKMRLAKLGKPKTEQHKEAMRVSHQKRKQVKLNGTHDNSLQIQE